MSGTYDTPLEEISVVESSESRLKGRAALWGPDGGLNWGFHSVSSEEEQAALGRCHGGRKSVHIGNPGPDSHLAAQR